MCLCGAIMKLLLYILFSSCVVSALAGVNSCYSSHLLTHYDFTLAKERERSGDVLLNLEHLGKAPLRSERGLTFNEGRTGIGAFTATQLLSKVLKSKQFTLYIRMKADSLSTKDARIFSLSGGSACPNDVNLQIVQDEQEGLRLRMRGISEVESDNSCNAITLPLLLNAASTASPTEEMQLMITYNTDTATLAAYLNGKKVISKRVPNALERWNTAYALAIGSEITAEHGWAGNVYELALWNRALTGFEVSDIYEGLCDSSNNQGRISTISRRSFLCSSTDNCLSTTVIETKIKEDEDGAVSITYAFSGAGCPIDSFSLAVPSCASSHEFSGCVLRAKPTDSGCGMLSDVETPGTVFIDRDCDLPLPAVTLSMHGAVAGLGPLSIQSGVNGSICSLCDTTVFVCPESDSASSFEFIEDAEDIQFSKRNYQECLDHCEIKAHSYYTKCIKTHSEHSCSKRQRAYIKACSLKCSPSDHSEGSKEHDSGKSHQSKSSEKSHQSKGSEEHYSEKTEQSESSEENCEENCKNSVTQSLKTCIDAGKDHEVCAGHASHDLTYCLEHECGLSCYEQCVFLGRHTYEYCMEHGGRRKSCKRKSNWAKNECIEKKNCNHQPTPQAATPTPTPKPPTPTPKPPTPTPEAPTPTSKPPTPTSQAPTPTPQAPTPLPPPPPPPPICKPECWGKECGADGCGGSCGSCDDYNKCTVDSCSNGGWCVFEEKDCNDYDACTRDYCDPKTGSCNHERIDGCESTATPHPSPPPHNDCAWQCKQAAKEEFDACVEGGEEMVVCAELTADKEKWCIKEKCEKKPCYGDGKEFDVCGVCGGDGSSCIVDCGNCKNVSVVQDVSCHIKRVHASKFEFSVWGSTKLKPSALVASFDPYNKQLGIRQRGSCDNRITDLMGPWKNLWNIDFPSNGWQLEVQPSNQSVHYSRNFTLGDLIYCIPADGGHKRRSKKSLISVTKDKKGDALYEGTLFMTGVKPVDLHDESKGEKAVFSEPCRFTIDVGSGGTTSVHYGTDRVGFSVHWKQNQCTPEGDLIITLETCVDHIEQSHYHKRTTELRNAMLVSQSGSPEFHFLDGTGCTGKNSDPDARCCQEWRIGTIGAGSIQEFKANADLKWWLFVKDEERTIDIKAKVDIHVDTPCGQNKTVQGGDFDAEVHLFRDRNLTKRYLYEHPKKPVFLDCERVYAKLKLLVPEEKCNKLDLKLKKILLCSSETHDLLPFDSNDPYNTGCQTPVPNLHVVTILDVWRNYFGGDTWNTTFIRHPPFCASEEAVFWTAHTIGKPARPILAQFTWLVHPLSSSSHSKREVTTSRLLNADPNSNYIDKRSQTVFFHEKDSEDKLHTSFRVVCGNDQIWNSRRMSCVARPMYDTTSFFDEWWWIIVIWIIILVVIAALFYCCCYKGYYHSSHKEQHHHHHHHHYHHTPQTRCCNELQQDDDSGIIGRGLGGTKKRLAVPNQK